MTDAKRVYTLEQCADGTYWIQYGEGKVLCRDIRDKSAGEFIVEQLNLRSDGLNEAGKHYLND